MASQIIGTTIAGTTTDSTGMAFQSHLVWAVNDSAWWLFFISNGATTTVQTFRSPDGVTWTAKTSSGAYTSSGTVVAGRSIGIAYKNISSNDIVGMFARTIEGSNDGSQHNRAAIASAAISYSGWASASGSQHAADTATRPGGCGSAFDSSNRPYDANNISGTPNIDGNPCMNKGTNTDAGTSWTAGMGAAAQVEAVTNSCNAFCLFDAGAGKLIGLWENASGTEPSGMTNVRVAAWSGTAWGTVGNVFTAFTAEDPNNFGAVALSTSDIHVVARTGSNTFVHKRVNASATVSAGDSITNQNNKAGAGLFMATNGTNVWLFCIDSAAANNVMWAKWTSGAGWSAWSTLESTSKTRGFLTGYPTVSNNLIGVVWSETNGVNFDIVFESLNTSSSIFEDEDGLRPYPVYSW